LILENFFDVSRNFKPHAPISRLQPVPLQAFVDTPETPTS